MYPGRSRVASTILAPLGEWEAPAVATWPNAPAAPKPGAFVMLGGMRGTADGSFSAEVKAAVTLRARSGCERCGRWCGEGAWAEHHHRIPRGMGGASAERAATLSSPANCLLLCARCHRWVESNRSAATDAGFLVPWSLDPAEVPVDVYDRGPTLLSVGGWYIRQAVSEGPSPRPGRLRARW